jgi:hypothetical protein
MQEHLYKFLVLYHKLSIPQLGSFTIDDEPARFDVPSGLLFPPKPVIHFGDAVEPMSDRIFFDFLTREMKVEEVMAIRAFHDFAYQFRNDIEEYKLALLPGVGRITKGSEGGLFFTQETSLLEFLPPIQLDNELRMPGDGVSKKAARELRKEPAVQSATEETGEEIMEDEEAATVRDRWWIPAVILLAVGLLALLFYYQ